MCSYQQINTGIDFGTNLLTEEVAFFLGSILSSDECISSNGTLYWISPVRYNYHYATDIEISQHYDDICTLSSSMPAPTFYSDEIKTKGLDSGKFRLPGFGTFFASLTGDDDITNILSPLGYALTRSSITVQKSFLAGVFDGRGAIDHNSRDNSIRFIALDSPNDIAGQFLYNFATSMGFICNYNRARDRVEGGNPRENQLRIKNVDTYITEIGYISTKRINVFLSSGYGTRVQLAPYLYGLKQLI